MYAFPLISYLCADSIRKESSKKSRYFLIVFAVIFDFFTVLNVFLNFSGLVREPIAEESIFNKSSSYASGLSVYSDKNHV